MALHPLAALMNHGCTYNAVVGFSGQNIITRPLRSIKKDEEIVISYIDTTYPYAYRRQELKAKYFFDCTCNLCEKGPDAERYVPGKAPVTVRKWSGIIQDIPCGTESSIFEATTKRALDLLESARKNTSLSSTIRKLQYGMHILREKPLCCAITTQPLAQLRHELIIALISNGDYASAFKHASIQYTCIDPNLFPQRHHPARVMHTWLYVSLMERMVEKGNVRTHHYSCEDVDFACILQTVLEDLQENLECVNDEFAEMVTDKWNELLDRTERTRKGGMYSEDDIENNWGRVEGMLNGWIWRENGVWEDGVEPVFD